MNRTATLIVLSLPLILSGCYNGNSNGKTIFDLVQIMLQQGGWTKWLFCVLLVIVVWQLFKLLSGAFRSIWWSYQQIKQVLFRWRPRNLIVAAVLGTLVWAVSEPLADVLQELEQRFFTPVWLGQYADLNEPHLTTIYEAELARQVDPYELEVIKRRTREMAEKIRSTPLAIYECAYLECGLNPFTVRRDGVAAGWIQFTRVGLGGLKYNGQSVSFDQVLYACKKRDINLMMDLSEIYLTEKYRHAGEKPLNNTIDLYLALFAPASIGAPHSKVIYHGRENPAYYLNKGLDGWYVIDANEGKKQIFRKESACDGAITIWEMYLALEAKKDRLVSRYLKR